MMRGAPVTNGNRQVNKAKRSERLTNGLKRTGPVGGVGGGARGIDRRGEREESTFSQTHKVGKNGINANFAFPYVYTFLHYLHFMMLVIVKLHVSW